jgi:hypothetical protein
MVPLLQRVTFEKRESNQSAFAPFVRCLAQARHALAPASRGGAHRAARRPTGRPELAHALPRSAWEYLNGRSASALGTQSIPGYIPTQSVGTIKSGLHPEVGPLSGRLRGQASLLQEQKQKQSRAHRPPRSSPLIRPSVSSPALDLALPAPSERRHAEPKRGAGRSGRAFFYLLFLAFEKKVSRRKGETLSGRYRRNGYVLSQQIIGRLPGRLRRQARPHTVR